MDLPEYYFMVTFFSVAAAYLIPAYYERNVEIPLDGKAITHLTSRWEIESSIGDYPFIFTVCLVTENLGSIIVKQI